MTKYDRSVLELYCTALTGYAWALILVGALIGGFIGAGAGMLIDELRPRAVHGVFPAYLGIAGALLFAMIGFLASYHYRVRAHEMLCQVEIEKHLSLLTTQEQQRRQPDTQDRQHHPEPEAEPLGNHLS